MKIENKIEVTSDMIKVLENSIDFYIYQKDLSSVPSKSMKVFYNKSMELNRDITNLAINAYSEIYSKDENLSVVETMAASGIAAIRIVKECPKIKKIIINDLNPLAIGLIKLNLKLNDIEIGKKVQLTHKDANLLLNEIAQSNKFNEIGRKSNISVVLIDPFGSPNKYLDSAFKAIKKESGLLCITATDTAVLFGIRPKSCRIKYSSKPLHTEYCKEVGARILLLFIIKIANMNNVGIKFLMTFYSNHFIRVFALTFKSKNAIRESLNNHGFFLHCNKCGYRCPIYSPMCFPRVCPNCDGSKLIDYGGPLWLGKLHDLAFLNHVLYLNENLNLKNKGKINKILNLAVNETNHPFTYYNIHYWAKKLNLSQIPKLKNIIKSIHDKNYMVSRTSFNFLSIKTDMNVPELEKTLLELTY